MKWHELISHSKGYFRSAEHKFQAEKALYMQEAESRLSVPDFGYDSQEAWSWLITSKDEIKACAEFGTIFDHFEESDPEWWASCVMHPAIPLMSDAN